MSEQIELLAMKDDATASDSEVCSDRSEGTVNNPEATRTTEQKYKTYYRRWYMLCSASVLSLSNGTMWLTYAPIPNETASFYGITLAQVDWFSISYFIVSLLIGFIAIRLIEKAGLRCFIVTGALMNFLGASLRVVSTTDHLRHNNHLGYMVAMVGQVCTAIAQPVFLYSPTMLSASWFSDQQRAIATSLASMANPVGIGVIYLLAPLIVHDEPNKQLPALLWYCAVLALIGFIMSLAWLFLGSKPPTPPSACADDDSKEPFLQGLKRAASTRIFWILLIVWGTGSGLFNALLTLLPQFLCPYGYSSRYIGIWGGVMVFTGLPGAIVTGVIIDLTKKFEEVAKVMFPIALICFIWFVEVFSLEDEPVLIAFSLCSFGFFAFSIMPIFLELGVELTYPTYETISSGLLWSATQLMGLLFTLIGQVLERDLPEGQEARSRCFGSIEPKDLTYTGLFFATVGVLGYCLFVIGLRHPRYKRVEAERSKSEPGNPT